MIKTSAEVGKDTTLEELREVRDEWLAHEKENRLGERVLSIVLAFGKDATDEHHGYRKVVELKVAGGITCTAWFIAGKFEKWLGKYLDSWAVRVDVGKDNVMRFSFFPESKQTKNMHYVHGLWINAVLAKEAEFSASCARFEEEAAEIERSMLAVELLAGKEV